MVSRPPTSERSVRQTWKLSTIIFEVCYNLSELITDAARSFSAELFQPTESAAVLCRGGSVTLNRWSVVERTAC